MKEFPVFWWSCVCSLQILDKTHASSQCAAWKYLSPIRSWSSIPMHQKNDYTNECVRWECQFSGILSVMFSWADDISVCFLERWGRCVVSRYFYDTETVSWGGVVLITKRTGCNRSNVFAAERSPLVDQFSYAGLWKHLWSSTESESDSF